MRFKKYIQLSAVLLCIYVYFKNSQLIITSVKDGLNLCYNVIIPSLFIFIVIFNIISSLKCCDMLAAPFMPYFRLININDRRTAAYCILSILGGFATGGIMLDRIQKEYEYDSNTLGILSIFMSGNSPSFVILAVGGYYLKNINTGIIIYLSILLSAFITAFFMSFLFPVNESKTTKTHLAITNNMVRSIKSSVTAILTVCGVVTLSTVVCNVFLLYSKNNLIFLAFSAFTEVTFACETVSVNFENNVYLLLLTLLVFPVSAYLQMKAIGDNNTLSFKILFLSKFIQLPIAFLIFRTAKNIFVQAINVYANGDISVNLYWNRPQLSFCLLLIAVYFVLLSDNKTEVFTN